MQESHIPRDDELILRKPVKEDARWHWPVPIRTVGSEKIVLPVKYKKQKASYYLNPLLNERYSDTFLRCIHVVHFTGIFPPILYFFW
jgi:hypothetical protein